MARGKRENKWTPGQTQSKATFTRKLELSCLNKRGRPFQDADHKSCCTLSESARVLNAGSPRFPLKRPFQPYTSRFIQTESALGGGVPFQERYPDHFGGVADESASYAIPQVGFLNILGPFGCSRETKCKQLIPLQWVDAILHRLRNPGMMNPL